jgi:hypothetical protein
MLRKQSQTTPRKVVKFGSTTCPVAAATRTRRGEGGKASTLDVAEAVADYAS